jgi:N-acetylneuraminic acid mutarotase
LDNDAENYPKTRDEHSAVILHDSMIVFGGFAFGERCNDIFKYTFRSNTWEKVKVDSKVLPCPRAGHSSIIRHTDKGEFMYIFGGKDDENNKLNDIWKFDF